MFWTLHGAKNLTNVFLSIFMLSNIKSVVPFRPLNLILLCLSVFDVLLIPTVATLFLNRRVLYQFSQNAAADTDSLLIFVCTETVDATKQRR